MSARRQEGFSLIEVLVATTVVAAGLGALAQLAIGAIRTNERARHESFAVLTASEKLEQLRSAAWAGDVLQLAPSPDESLEANTAGYFEILDRGGTLVIEPDENGLYVRRWSIEGNADPDLFRIHVVVERRGSRARTHLVGSARLHAGL
jgi:prepilin-type N-terminal cleavage/methylation domain-containing protein